MIDISIRRDLEGRTLKRTSNFAVHFLHLELDVIVTMAWYLWFANKGGLRWCLGAYYFADPELLAT